ncbi:MAG: hypothetical protein AB1490_17355 [Pseudomonadota bacterium]
MTIVPSGCAACAAGGAIINAVLARRRATVELPRERGREERDDIESQISVADVHQPTKNVCSIRGAEMTVPSRQRKNPRQKIRQEISSGLLLHCNLRHQRAD